MILPSFDILCFVASDGVVPEKDRTYVPCQSEVVVNISGGSVSALNSPASSDVLALPACFQVVTRAISWEWMNLLGSASIMYADDIIGVGLARAIDYNIALTRNVCTIFFGTTTVADDKTEVGRCVDAIGYTIVSDTQRVGVQVITS